MRNLLGRLNARSAEELGRIAAAWQAPVSGGDKLGQVARLYRVLTDPRAARDVWARLPDDERALIAILARGDEKARPLADIAAELDQPEAEVRQVAARLYHKGIVVREGDDDPLPVGEAPKLFLPREVALLFQKVQSEIAAGDVSQTSLTSLLERRDDREIEEAAETWGVRVIPGLRTREELIRQILQNVGDPQRLSDVQNRLKRDAASIWQRLRDDQANAPVPLAEAALVTGLNPDEPRQAIRLRQALGELEDALLVWHTYLDGGSRFLFVPIEIRSPRTHLVEEVILPKRAEPAPERSGIRQTHAVAWDLLTLLRALSPPQDAKIVDMSAAPANWLRALNARLWNRGGDAPPSGYLDFLVDLARVEGLLTGGDAAIEEPFQVTSAVRAWRDRSFPEQMARLRSTWLSGSSWIEGTGREDVEVWGADWPGFRFKLLSQLSALDEGAAYELDDVAAWLAARDPEMLGSTFEVATARNTEVVTDPAASRRAAVAEVARVALETGFAWFGLVDIARNPRKPLAVRVTGILGSVARSQMLPEPSPGVGPAMTVTAEGEIALAQPSPLRVWSLGAFADLVELGDPSRYRMTEDSIARALRAGFELRHVESFLTNQSGAALPGPLTERFREWSAGVRRIRISRAFRLLPDDPGHVSVIIDALSEAKFEFERRGEELLVTVDDAVDPSPREALLLTRLRDLGFTTQGIETGAPARPGVAHPRRP